MAHLSGPVLPSFKPLLGPEEQTSEIFLFGSTGTENITSTSGMLLVSLNFQKNLETRVLEALGEPLPALQLQMEPKSLLSTQYPSCLPSMVPQ